MSKLALLVIVFSFINTPEKLNAQENSKASFWSIPQKGANIFNKRIKREDIRAAKAYGITFIRLAPDKFISKERDFLIGNADGYHKLDSEDLSVFYLIVNTLISSTQ